MSWNLHTQIWWEKLKCWSMQNKANLPIISVLAALGTAAISLYGTVKSAAVKKLDHDGAFEQIRAEGLGRRLDP